MRRFPAVLQKCGRGLQKPPTFATTTPRALSTSAGGKKGEKGDVKLNFLGFEYDDMHTERAKYAEKFDPEQSPLILRKHLRKFQKPASDHDLKEYFGEEDLDQQGRPGVKDFYFWGPRPVDEVQEEFLDFADQYYGGDSMEGILNQISRAMCRRPEDIPYHNSTTDRLEHLSLNETINARRTYVMKKEGGKAGISVCMVVGDHKSYVGVGIASGEEYEMAYIKAFKMAIRSALHITPLYGRALFHPLYGKAGATRVILTPTFLGGGFKGSPVIHTICNACGIEDCTARIIGDNKYTSVARATMAALAGHKDIRTVASMGQKRMVEINREFFRGNRTKLHRATR